MANKAGFLTSIATAIGLSTSASAEQMVMDHYADYIPPVAEHCVPDKWATNACLEAVTNSNADLVAIYSGQLTAAGRLGYAFQVLNDCAAAADFEANKASILRNDFAVCANQMSDIFDATGITPILPAQYDILVGAVQCMDDHPRCKAVYEPALLAQQR